VSGWEDIDGSLVMCGSPGRIICLDLALKGVLGFGDAHNSLGSFTELLRICKDKTVAEELKVAAQLIQLARRVLCGPSGTRTPLWAAKDAIELMRKATAGDRENLRTWQENRRYIEAEYARGEDWWVEQ
jgi:hypothetical protein